MSRPGSDFSRGKAGELSLPLSLTIGSKLKVLWNVPRSLTPVTSAIEYMDMDEYSKAA